jgi:hypothetical protein
MNYLSNNGIVNDNESYEDINRKRKILILSLKKVESLGFTQRFSNSDLSTDRIGTLLNFNNYYSVIFNHEFAKRFWGTGSKRPSDCSIGHIYDIEPDDDWKDRLMYMVTCEEPLYYLEEFLIEWGIIE